MIRTIATAAALAAAGALLAASPASAQAADFKAIEAKNLGTKSKIDPAKGYILISSLSRSFGTFIKTPSDAERAEFQADWDKQFAKAQKRYARDIKTYEADVANERSTGRKPGAKPVEPTRENFSIGDIERRMTISYGPMFVFEKADNDAVSYLIEVEPGSYNYYGPVMTMPNGAAFGTCYCMGSVRFDVKPGVITNLGDFLSGGWISDEARRLSMAVVPEAMLGKTPMPAAYSLPVALKPYTVETADWRAAAKMNNFFGITVGRMPPVEGVLAYDRDKVIDLKAR